MIAWVNFIILLLATILTVFYYVKSAGPAALEQKIGPSAYAKCTRYRTLSGIFMGLAGVNYIVYAFYPPAIYSGRNVVEWDSNHNSIDWFLWRYSHTVQ